MKVYAFWLIPCELLYFPKVIGKYRISYFKEYNNLKMLIGILRPYPILKEVNDTINGEIGGTVDGEISSILVKIFSGDYVLEILSIEPKTDDKGNIIEASMHHRIEYDTGLFVATDYIQEFYNYQVDMIDPEIQRKLLGIRANITYMVNEAISMDGFYFVLEIVKKGLIRKYIYRLYYNMIPCYSENKIIIDLPLKVGALLMSSDSFKFPEIPTWYIRETFRDIIMSNSFNMMDKIMIEGPKTGNLYIFYNGDFNLTSDIQDKYIRDILNHIKGRMEVKIFPTSTPNLFIDAKAIKETPSGIYSINYPIPDFINPYTNEYKISFDLDNLAKLFWFLRWLMLLPTYLYILKEIKINLRGNASHILYSTIYLPDFVRISAYPKTVTSTPDINVELSTHANVIETQASFVDTLTGMRYYLITNDVNLPTMDHEIPDSFSISSRLMVDGLVG
jgi:hypothetical protein